MRQIVNEAERIQENCPHVSNPQAPILIHGSSPLQMCDQLETLAESARSKNGSKLRKDARILLSGVMSYPMRMNTMNTHPLHDKEFIDWLKRSREFLREHFGEDFRSAVLHLDESHPHIHFYCHQDLAEDLTLDLKAIHPGLAAEQTLRQQLKRRPKKTELSDANSAGLTLFQDAYHNSVSQHFGHKRSTEKRQRLKPTQFRKQEQAQKINDLEAALDEQNEELDALQHLNQAQQQEISKLQRYIGKLEKALTNLCQKLGLNGDHAVQVMRPKGP